MWCNVMGQIFLVVQYGVTLSNEFFMILAPKDQINSALIFCQNSLLLIKVN